MRQREQSVVLDSDLNSIHQVESFIEQISDDFNINHTFFGNILLAVTEAFRNAVIHGGPKSENGKVQIQFSSESGNLIFYISDKGHGFDFNALPDPTMLSSDGQQRGLFLIKSLSDEVFFHDGGRMIEIRFGVNRVNRVLADDRAAKITASSTVEQKKQIERNENS